MPSSDKALQDYLQLMHELAIRIEMVIDAIKGQLQMPPAYAYEYGYFQFRRICELLALGCLKLSGCEIKYLKKEWNAARIMQALLKEHARAFPEPAFIDSNNMVSPVSESAKKKALARAEFKGLYGKCNHVLHRGSIDTFEKNGRVTKAELVEVLSWCDKYINLLNSHVVRRTDNKEFYFIQMKTKNGRPHGLVYKVDNQHRR